MPDTVTNREAAAKLSLLADLLEISGEPVFKVVAYRRAAENIASHPRSLYELRDEGSLQSIAGVGPAIAEKIDSLLTTGSFKLFNELTERYPASLADLLPVPDIGPKRARLLYEQLGIDGLPALKEAVASGRLAAAAGIGPKAAERIANGLTSMDTPDTRLPLGQARAQGELIIRALRDTGVAVRDIVLAGSIRRFRETIGDIDIVAAADDTAAVVDRFASLDMVERVDMRGANRCRIVPRNGIPADLRVLPPEHWGSLLHHFTGGKSHNVALRDMALARGASMSEYGFKVGDQLMSCSTEEAVYAFLEMQYVPPPMRENNGEIARAVAGTLPGTVQVSDLRGDLHTHSTWSDGTLSIAEMARAAVSLGYEYLAVTDHSQGLAVANGLTPERLAREREEIDRLNQELRPFRVLQGVELEVRATGELDLPDDVLAKLDIVVASVHSGLRQGRQRVTSRALAAINHPLVDILAHPTGRIVGGRTGGDFDMEALFAAAAETGTVLEINSDPARMDLRDDHARAAVETGCLISIDSDAHSAEGLSNSEYGCAIASRAWICADRVLNTLPLDQMLSRLKRNRR